MTDGMKMKDDHPDESSPQGSIWNTQDVVQRDKELGITDLPIKVQDTGGNGTILPGPRPQAALRSLAHSGLKTG